MVTKFTDSLKKFFGGAEGVKPGIYHYQREVNNRKLRLHLRVDPDKSGILSVNAAGVLHLNATAAELMKHILEGKDINQAVSEVRKVYKASRKEVEDDYHKINEIIHTMDTAEDACPIFRVNADVEQPFGRDVTAPYRADLALNYDCNNKCQHCYVARDPSDLTYLDLDEWKKVLDRVWKIGIPHVCFTGGEATMSPHLHELIERAEDIGIITGLLTNGRKLADRNFTKKLVTAGLDHVQITLESHDEKIHDEMVGAKGAFKETVEGIKNALAEDIYLVTNTTISSLNADSIEQTVEFIHKLGIEQFAMNSLIYTGKAPESGIGIAETELEPILGTVADKAEELGMRFIWYSPTHYCKVSPASIGLGYKRCTAAEYNVCIEPDGQVIPCQSYYEPAGHILKDDWKKIWNHPLFLKIRKRENVADDCRECPDFEVCGSGCPLNSGDEFLCSDSTSEG